jgi:hypothetical protein
MDPQKRTLMAKDLAETFHRAAERDNNEEGKARSQIHATAPQQGFVSEILQGSFATSLWQTLATKLIAIVEEVVREQLDAFIVRHGGATGGLFVAGTNQNDNPNRTPPPDEPA